MTIAFSANFRTMPAAPATRRVRGQLRGAIKPSDLSGVSVKWAHTKTNRPPAGSGPRLPSIRIAAIAKTPIGPKPRNRVASRSAVALFMLPPNAWLSCRGHLQGPLSSENQDGGSVSFRG